MQKEKIIRKTILVMVLLILFAYTYFQGIECVYLKYFHVICPGCGMTRAIRALVRLDFVGAFRYHPMVYSLPVVFLYILMDGRVFRRKIFDNTILLLIGSGFVINYVIKLIGFFA